jgi:glycogen phosphorylase
VESLKLDAVDHPGDADDRAGLALLRELALDLRWSWNHATDELWSQLAPELWSRTRNPWVVLQTLSRQRLGQLLANPEFRTRVDHLVSRARQAALAASWFQQTHGASGLERVAYFSMEFMLSEALPIYAGGLGNVAGDQLKSASDLGVPVAGVSLLYQRGYFHQLIAGDGAQRAVFPYNEPGQLPVTPLRQPDGEWLRVEIALPDHSLWLRAWQVKVGRLHLYLLDSNDLANDPANRGITGELYGVGSELRLQQELVLGIGGWRLLKALGLRVDVCHLNEGHAAFAVLERVRSFMRETGRAFDVALSTTRAGNVFTTHTAVPAGFDCFAPPLVAQYLGKYATRDLHIPVHELLALGRRNAADDSESFNMAYLALRGSGSVNGVSRLHAQVSRRIFLPLFPQWPESEVPVGHVTNGVHMPSWDSRGADELWTRACGKDRWMGTLESLDEGIRSVSAPALWQCRTAARAQLVDYARARLTAQLAVSGASAVELQAARQVFNADALTLGFARRFATYKRPNLLLHDPQRLIRLLSSAQRPVQLIVAGKAHPADEPGQTLVREWVQFVRRPDVRPHAVFLADHDMLMTEYLTQGVDVWINTPRRPWEACGTSGMKVLVNGGLNVSELDGWWAEAYAPSVGWALGDGYEHEDDPAWDALEAGRLYELLETQIVPEFYARDAHGIPQAWVARIRESMAKLTPVYSANRSVRQYVERCYLPAADSFQRRAADGEALGVQLADRLRRLEQGWSTLHFGRVSVDTRDGRHHFSVEVELGTLEPHAVRVQLYAEALTGAEPLNPEMSRSARTAEGTVLYVASVPATRMPADYTPRIIPALPASGNVPLEATHILWQR